MDSHRRRPDRPLASSAQLNAGAAWAHSGIDTGTREPTDVRTVDLTNMSLVAAIVQLTERLQRL